MEGQAEGTKTQEQQVGITEKFERMANYVMGSSVVSGGVISVAGSLWYIFRRGPYRAIKLGISSMRWKAPVHSIRAREIEQVKSKLAYSGIEDFVVVVGPKGVGKTCIVDTALEKRPGVLRLSVPSGKGKEDILHDVFGACSGSHSDLDSKKFNSECVLKWHNRIFPSYPMIVALQLDERFPPPPPASTGPAARDLRRMGFKVIVDTSQHAYDGKKTLREVYVEVDYMSKDMLFGVPEFESFFKKLDSCLLKEQVWEVLGGHPQLIQQLVDLCEGKDAIDEIVVDFLFVQLQNTLHEVNQEIKRLPDLKSALGKFAERPLVASINDNESPYDTSNVKCLRAIREELYPSDPTIAFLLRIGLDDLDVKNKNMNLKEKKEKLNALVARATSNE